MKEGSSFHIVTVGSERSLVEGLWDLIAKRSGYQFSHIMHPRYTRKQWGSAVARSDMHFFRDDLRQRMPEPDHQFLASLEADGIPTIHNMIMGDRVVSRLDYGDALRYATFLARRMIELFSRIQPSVIIGGFDAIHGGIGFAVAKHLGIPWFALHFTAVPPGLACFCDRQTPAAGVLVKRQSRDELYARAEVSLKGFETKNIEAAAYIAPPPLSIAGKVIKLPARLSALWRTIRKSRLRKFLQFTEERSGHSVLAAVKLIRRTTAARKAIARVETISSPPGSPYILFGLHMQPESSIDVWAPFFSNQLWVIELLARSIPPTHKLLVKIHKSDISNYTREQLERMRALPGVELVAPFADTRKLVEGASLLILIQGTMGLEGALLGKPVIMLGESPFAGFPSVSKLGEIGDLPSLVRRKLNETPPSRSSIVDAYAEYLAPFLPASSNNWSVGKDAGEIEGYGHLFEALRQHLSSERLA